jgi:hypothetical protein
MSVGNGSNNRSTQEAWSFHMMAGLLLFPSGPPAYQMVLPTFTEGILPSVVMPMVSANALTDTGRRVLY